MCFNADSKDTVQSGSEASGFWSRMSLRVSTAGGFFRHWGRAAVHALEGVSTEDQQQRLSLCIPGRPENSPQEET